MTPIDYLITSGRTVRLSQGLNVWLLAISGALDPKIFKIRWTIYNTYIRRNNTLNKSSKLRIALCSVQRYLIDFHAFLQMSDFLLRSNVTIEFDDIDNMAMDKLNTTPTVRDTDIKKLRDQRPITVSNPTNRS